ncbi:MAG: ribulose-phosphate 3-epimerase [Planctomycetota bacterium]
MVHAVGTVIATFLATAAGVATISSRRWSGRRRGSRGRVCVVEKEIRFTMAGAGIEIERVADEDAVGRAAAGLFVRQARKAAADRGRFAVALSGGAAIRLLLERLTDAPYRERVPWERVELFWTDERAVPLDHAESSYRAARASLLDAVGISPARIHRMPAEGTDVDAAADAYQDEIADVLGVPTRGAPPALDLVCLTMDPDGHTAALFPHAEALKPTERWVVGHHGPKLESGRMTMTPAILNRARCVAFLVTGGNRAQRLREVLEGLDEPEALPIQSIRPVSGRLVWIVDRAAAGRLTGSTARVVRLAPSILSADFTRLGEQVAEAERAGADRIHVDVMDGHFVPNISIGTVVIRSLRRSTSLPLETHLMITDPDRHAEAFAEAGSDRIIFHLEVVDDPVALAGKIRSLGASPGVVVNPETPAAALVDVVPHVDLALVMTVHPGFGGQAFLTETLPKIAEVRRMIDQAHPVCDLEVDGGIDPRTVPRVVEAGARVLVAGSAVFGCDGGIEAAMKSLRDAVPVETAVAG